jgi:hypothetical protein
MKIGYSIGDRIMHQELNDFRFGTVIDIYNHSTYAMVTIHWSGGTMRERQITYNWPKSSLWINAAKVCNGIDL